MKRIYTLRMQCEEHKLDRAIIFYRVPNATSKEMFDAHEKRAIEEWPKTHKCRHDITFTRIIDKEYRWDTKLNKAVKRVGGKLV